ncbi:MAG: transposase [Candidatus Marsarchaeota archaeon]|nr:transposase [Candidatus Marsarchaeota archaeon]
MSQDVFFQGKLQEPRLQEASKRREDAKAHLSQEWANVTNQSNDFAHKLADHLINSGYTSFVVEKLNIKNMVKNHNLAQAIHNAAWSRSVDFLSYKAESAGMKVMKINPDNTTQECSSCHNVKRGKEKLTLKDRVYNCFVCGLVMDRDVNASINILNRATLGQRGSHAQGEKTSAVQQAPKSRLEELRTDKTHPLQDAVIA